MNKKGMAEWVMVSAAASIVLIVVILLVLWPAYEDLFKGAESRGECNWNLFLAAAVKAGSLGLAEIEPGCQAEYITVDSELLKNYHSLANKRIRKYHEQNLPAKNNFEYTEKGATYDAMNEWALDFVVGKKMEQCWDKVWHGKLDFFSRTWGILQGDRTVCVICTVIRFSDDMPATLRQQTSVNSLYNWAQAEPYTKTTYYEYIAEGQTIKPKETEMQYTTKVPLAVMYVQTKESIISKSWGAIGGAFAGTVAGFKVGTAFSAPLWLIPGVGWVAAPAVQLLSTAGGAVLAAYTGQTIKEELVKDGDIKQLSVHPYQLLERDITQGGLGCTEVIA